MFEDHIMKIRNGCTIEELTKISMPVSRSDPLNKQMMPIFHYSSIKSPTQKSNQQSYINENIKLIEPKLIPSTHHIETQFDAYSKAKITNRPLFSKLSHNLEQSYEKLKNRSATASRFHTSRYPNVPLTKELTEKVEFYHSYYKSENKSSKKTLICKLPLRNSSSRKFTKSNKLLNNFQLWEKLKKEKCEASRSNKTISEASLKNNQKELNDISASQYGNRPNTETQAFRNHEQPKKMNEFISTIDSISSMISPMAPIYASNNIYCKSGNLTTSPFTKYEPDQ